MDYQIPLFELNYDQQEEDAVMEVLKSKWISSGGRCEELEALFCNKWNVAYANAVSSCTAALHLAMMAIGIGCGDEVIVPSMTFVATVNAISYVGGIPVFCDVISKEDLTICPEQVRSLITAKTKAIVVMHYAGFPCHMDEILQIAHEYGLKVIEDACHGPLSEYHGKKLGTIGDIGCFSFFANKNISTGEGGIVVTNCETYSRKIKLLRSHGMSSMSYERAKGHCMNYDVVGVGYNYRLDDIRASLGIVQVKKLKEDLDKRAIIRDLYLKELSCDDNLVIPFQDCNEFASNYIMPIVLKNSNREWREAVRGKLAIAGIQTSVHYPAVHRFSIYKNAKCGKLDVTEYLADCEISLPMHSSLTKAKVSYICKILKDVCRQGED